MLEKIDEDIYLFSGYVANGYLIFDDGKILIIDPATPSLADEMLKFLKDFERLPKIISATHFHFDHIAGVDFLKKTLGEAKLCFFSYVKNYFLGEKVKFPPLKSWIFNLFPIWRSFGFKFFKISDLFRASFAGIPFLKNRMRSYPDYFLEDGEMITSSYKVVFTPGHSKDHISFVSEKKRVAILGDLLLNIGGTLMLNPFCIDREELIGSLKRLRNFSVERVLCGHGRPYNGDLGDTII